MRIPSVLTDQARSSQIRSDPVRSGQIQSDPVRSGQIQSDPVRSSQIRSDPVRSGQIGSDPVRSSQIRFFFVLIQIQNFWARTQIEMIHFNKSKIYSPKSIWPLLEQVQYLATVQTKKFHSSYDVLRNGFPNIWIVIQNCLTIQKNGWALGWIDFKTRA